MKRWLIFIFVLAFCISGVYAHQPRNVMGRTEIAVSNPEISQAFYGELVGQENYFNIDSSKDFELYVNLLAPKYGRSDFQVEILNISKIYGGNWTSFYEEFAGDNYLKGPEFDENVSVGKYRIIVSNPSNVGKYVLAVGKVEQFSVKDILVLPKIKHNFFNKSYFAVFQGIIGSFLLALVLIILAFVFSILLIVKRLRRKKSRKR